MKPGWQGRGLGRNSADRVEPERTRFTGTFLLTGALPAPDRAAQQVSPKPLHFHSGLGEVTRQLHLSLVSSRLAACLGVT